jgi:hypothetical protein
MGMSYTVVPMRMDEQHREALLRLWKENSFDPRANDCAAERFAWLYEDSATHDAGTWLAIDRETDAVIGCASTFRSDRHMRGHLVGAGVPAVFFVDRRHRVAAAALGLQRALVAGGCAMGLDVLVGKPNRSARAVCDRVGYQTVAALHDWVRVLWGDNSLSNRRPGGDADDILSAADGRFDDLWHRAKDRFPMIAVKTSAFLNWRYSAFRENYRFYCLERHDDRRLLGYIVFYAMKDGVVITDLFCEEPSGPILENLLSGFCARMKTEGQVWISVWYAGPASFEDCLARAGFSRGKHQRDLLAYVNPDAGAGLRARIGDRDSWFIFGGEMDVLLSDEVWRDRGEAVAARPI